MDRKKKQKSIHSLVFPSCVRTAKSTARCKEGEMTATAAEIKAQVSLIADCNSCNDSFAAALHCG